MLSDIGLRPSKGRGQNFLVTADVARKIVATAPDPLATAVEIGPGLGALTEALLEKEARVFAIEIDRRLCGHLRRRFGDVPRLQLTEGDALEWDWQKWLAESPAPRILFGNLPYSISAPIIEKIFQYAGLFSEAILCLQTEVAERILSDGGRGMGPITLLARRFCARREKLFHISPGAFFPSPKVSSTVIRLVLNPAVTWSEADRRIPRLLFAHRRKVLSHVVPPDILAGRLDTKGRSYASRRIDELSIDEAADLAEQLRQQVECR